MSTPASEPFGSLVYEELRRISGFSVISSTLDYQGIQRLKQADREGVIALFGSTGQDLKSVIESATATVVAEAIWEHAQKHANLSNADATFMILQMISWF